MCFNCHSHTTYTFPNFFLLCPRVGGSYVLVLCGVDKYCNVQKKVIWFKHVTKNIIMCIYRLCYNYHTIKNVGGKKLWRFWQITSNSPRFFGQISQNCVYIWLLVYGSIFPFRVSTLNLQYCNNYWVYFYNKFL